MSIRLVYRRVSMMLVLVLTSPAGPARKSNAIERRDRRISILLLETVTVAIYERVRCRVSVTKISRTRAERHLYEKPSGSPVGNILTAVRGLSPLLGATGGG